MDVARANFDLAGFRPTVDFQAEPNAIRPVADLEVEPVDVVVGSCGESDLVLVFLVDMVFIALRHDGRTAGSDCADAPARAADGAGGAPWANDSPLFIDIDPLE